MHAIMNDETLRGAQPSTDSPARRTGDRRRANQALGEGRRATDRRTGDRRERKPGLAQLVAEIFNSN
jgi:hypothetical protein